MTTSELEGLRLELALLESELTARHRAEVRDNFYAFVRWAWSLVDPAPLDDGWYLAALCDHLQSLIDGRHPTRKLLINIPPRFAKSRTVAVLFPAWVWIKKPKHQFLCLSFDGDLALRDAVASRRLMVDPRYRALINAGEAWEFQGDQNNKSYYENTKGGHRISGAIGAGVTGKGADTIIVDDAHDTRDSPAEIEKTVKDFDAAIESRINDRRTASYVGVGQRVGIGDLTGHLRTQAPDQWDLLKLRFWYDEDKDDNGNVLPKPRTMLGFEDPRTVIGEVLLPVRYGPAEQAQIRAKGSHHVATQYQQDPTVLSGGIFKREDFGIYTRATMPKMFDGFLISVDLAFKGTPLQQVETINTGHSFVVLDFWGFSKSNAYLLDQARGQWDFERSVAAFKKHHELWTDIAGRDVKSLIEDKANGPALQSRLQGAIPMLVLVEPNGSKVDRAFACQGYVEGRNVWLPGDAPWLGAWLDEVCGFPNWPQNDRVDTMTQCLIHRFAKLNLVERFRLQTA